MRNVIRNIYTCWRNVLGRTLNPFPPFGGLPYSFTVTPQLAKRIEIFYSSFSHYNITEIEFVKQGISDTQTYYTFDQFGTIYEDLTPGSTFVIKRAGNIRKLYINNILIVDND